jgi:hypothetical protein
MLDPTRAAEFDLDRDSTRTGAAEQAKLERGIFPAGLDGCLPSHPAPHLDVPLATSHPSPVPLAGLPPFASAFTGLVSGEPAGVADG